LTEEKISKLKCAIKVYKDNADSPILAVIVICALLTLSYLITHADQFLANLETLFWIGILVLVGGCVIHYRNGYEQGAIWAGLAFIVPVVWTYLLIKLGFAGISAVNCILLTIGFGGIVYLPAFAR
jgi:hypothetical protein